MSDQMVDNSETDRKTSVTEEAEPIAMTGADDTEDTIEFGDIKDEDLKQLFIENIPSDEDLDQLEMKSEIFVSVFDFHFKTRKAIKLHEILADITVDLNSKLLTSDHKLSQIYGKSILELPFGQSLKIWSIFLSKFSIENHFLMKLFSIFLQHIRCLDDSLPNHLIPQFYDLQKQSRVILKTTTKYLTSDNQQLIEILLDLYFSFKSLLILQMTYNSIDLSDDKISEKLVPNKWYDLSVIYDFTEDTDWKNIFENIDVLSPQTIQSLVRSLYQKLHFWKVIETNSDLNQNEKQVVKKSVNQLMSALIKNFAENHLNAFTLNQINAIVRHLKREDLCLLTDSLATNAIKPDIIRLLIDGIVWESIEFQTAFIGSFWRQIAKKFGSKKRKLDEDLNKIEELFVNLSTNHSFWFKYATLSPVSSETNKLWSYIKDLSEQTKQLIEELEVKTEKTLKILTKLLQVFNDSVPLEYLLPANQMRCLLSLSLLLFAIDFTDETKRHLLDLILSPFLRIFDGIRSVWFFNFIDPSVYIIEFLKVVKNYENNQKLKILITKFVENIFRNTTQIENLKNKLIESEDQIPFELLIMIETIILKRSLQVMNLQSVPKKMLELRQFCSSFSHQLSNTIHNQIKNHLKSESNIESMNSILVIDSFSAVFEFQVSKSTSDEETIKLKTKWRKLLTKMIEISTKQLTIRSMNDSFVNFLVLLCEQRKKLANILPENFISDLWQVLYRIDKQKDVLQLENTMKGLTVDEFVENQKDYKELFDSVDHKNRNHFLDSISDQISFLKLIKPLVIAIIQNSSAQEFQQFLQLLMNQLKTLDYSLASYTLNLWIGVFESKFQSNEEKNLLFRKFLNDLMTLSANQCQKCNEKENILLSHFQLNIKVPVLVIMRSILHITKNTITSPQIFLAYNACIGAKPDVYLNEPEVFIRLFEAIYGVLNETLLQHKYIAISSMASFNLIVKNLMHSLMTISDEQKFVDYEPFVRHELEICSKNMDRLLTLMASLASDYYSYAPHLIAAYVTQTQTVSVQAVIKKNIISGMNRLLKLLSTSGSNHNLDMIYSRMNESSRKIFKMLFDNYDKYYKFKGQV